MDCNSCFSIPWFYATLAKGNKWGAVLPNEFVFPPPKKRGGDLIHKGEKVDSEKINFVSTIGSDVGRMRRWRR